MQFWEDHGELMIGFELDAHEEDLSVDQATRILTAGVRGMRDAFNRQQSPAGNPWAELSPEYQRRRQGKLPVGIQSGTLYGALDYYRGDSDPHERGGSWRYQGPAYAKHFNAQRPFVGWTREAQAQARAIAQGL